MSDSTINSARHALGYDSKEQITGQGFRATARTLIRELLGCDREVIERHLANGSDEELGGAYDRATFLNQRRKMIQLWADLLDDLASDKALAMPASTEFATAWALEQRAGRRALLSARCHLPTNLDTALVRRTAQSASVGRSDERLPPLKVLGLRILFLWRLQLLPVVRFKLVPERTIISDFVPIDANGEVVLY